MVTEPPPCLTVGTIHFGSNFSFGLLQTITFPSDPKRLNFDSSDQTTISQKSIGFFNISFAYLRRFIRFILLMYGFFRATRPNNPASCAQCQTVDVLINIFNSFSSSLVTLRADFRRSDFNFRWINRSVVAVVLRCRSQPNRFPIHLIFLYFLIIDCTVARLNNAWLLFLVENHHSNSVKLQEFLNHYCALSFLVPWKLICRVWDYSQVFICLFKLCNQFQECTRIFPNTFAFFIQIFFWNK
jgi:hypothetical protein